MAGIYVHIPFCKQACYYCDFHFSTNQDKRAELVNAIKTELELQKSYLGESSIETIYFGGGTPSILEKDEIQSTLNTIQRNYSVIDNPEITLEANPDDLTKTKLEQFYSIGINRLSIGIQSFQNNQLKFLNRVHDSASATECVLLSRAAGFKNISIDLIYGIQDEGDALWIDDINKAIELNPEHISCYSLTIEEKTVFGKWRASGKLKPTDDEVAARHLEILMERLKNEGYEQYEISNFSKPGYESKHNSSYWKQSPYLGVGPSAHSFDGLSRQYNIGNNNLYVKAIEQGVIPFEKEILTNEDKVNEYILTTLRTKWGTNLNTLSNEYKYNIMQEHKDYLAQLIEGDLIQIKGDTLYLTEKGKLLADKISSDLFLIGS